MKFLLHKDKEEKGKADPQNIGLVALPCKLRFASLPKTCFFCHRMRISIIGQIRN